MEEKKQSFKEFALKYRLNMHFVPVCGRPDADNWTNGSRHYVIILERVYAGKAMEPFFFSMGPGLKGKPDLPSILNCLAGAYIESLEEWSFNFGPPQTIADLKAYKASRKASKQMKKFFGDSLLKELLECERL